MDNKVIVPSYKRYNTDIPEALHARPPKFIKHVMLRLPYARNMKAHNFHVSDGTEPSCSCPDFHRHNYPCAHIIKLWILADGTLSIPQHSSPWWNVDNYNDRLHNTATIPESVNSSQAVSTAALLPTSIHQSSVHTKLRMCLEEIRLKSYNLCNQQAETVLHQLNNIKTQ